MSALPKILLLALLSASLSFVSCSKSNDADRTINVDDNDPEMNTAIAKARETLPKFWAAFDHPGPGQENFSLKVKITDGKEAEHFWTEDVQKKNGKIFATIANDPDSVHNVKLGDRIEIPEADISDWFYMQNGKMVGNYTIRVLFKQMPADEVAKYKAILAEP
jgi:uncharacterized protein YegJ (DUF2314 family)